MLYEKRHEGGITINQEVICMRGFQENGKAMRTHEGQSIQWLWPGRVVNGRRPV